MAFRQEVASDGKKQPIACSRRDFRLAAEISQAVRQAGFVGERTVSGRFVLE